MNKYIGYLATIIILSSCTNEDFTVTENLSVEKEYSNAKKSDFTEPISYEIINEFNKIVGEITLTEYHEMLKAHLKTNEKYLITSFQLYAGTFKETLDYHKFPFQVKLAKPLSEYPLLIEKKPLEFDKNNCIFLSCHIEIQNKETLEIEKVWVQSRALPGLKGVKTLLFCSVDRFTN
ncbi:MAG: hypothetical protein RBR78_11095 [Flavobacteriaceae bacterium]|jgi:hypothetical protein|nr:hypothetical protein [Flavobacteriaceae bacterium]